MKTTMVTLSFLLIATISYAQTAESLKARIQEHYTAINSNQKSLVYEHHLPDFSLFPGSGGALFEPGFGEAAGKCSTDVLL